MGYWLSAAFFRRLSDNTVYEVLIRLQREFVHPKTGGPSQVHQAGRTWVLIEERKEQAGESMYTGNRPIPQVAVRLKAEGLAVSVKTLYRWQAEGILCGQNLEDLWYRLDCSTAKAPPC